MLRSQFPVEPGRNIGSKERPAFNKGCVAAGDVDLVMADRDAVECIWDPNARFKGWHPRATGVTGYFRYLTEIAGF
jgi:hypothetical protein